MKELWLKKENAKVDCADDAVAIIDSGPLAIHAKGKTGTYLFGRFEFFENFTKPSDDGND
jgi:hypothetical protein